MSRSSRPSAGGDRTPAVAVGGPLDGSRLGGGTAERYDVRMADGSVHVYVRSWSARDAEVVWAYAGRG